MDHYLTDLTAIARAQEAWRLQDEDKRWYELISAKLMVFSDEIYQAQSIMYTHMGVFTGVADTESAARAWALWRACGGVE
jgi:hypothetical protein